MRRVCLLALLAACGDGTSATTTPDAAAGGCALVANTSATAKTSASGCAVLARDTSACSASRTAAGLDGFWLKFSCRVELAAGASTVSATADGQPDYSSNYFSDGDACHESYSGGIQNPNHITVEHYVIDFPRTPGGHGEPMDGAVVGLALNGVPIFGNFAAPGDDIFQEARTFDRCNAHPSPQGMYHYHAEPYAISDDDDGFIGVMRDGSPIYGRRDPDGNLPSDLDASGGHTGVTVDSPSTPVYHYHTNLQTSTTPGTSGEQEWFLTTGTYHAATGSCTGCN